MKAFDNILKASSNFTYKLRRKKPEILIVTGTIAVIGSVISMWNTKEKVTKVLDKHDESIKMIHEKKESTELVTKSEINKLTTKTYIKTGIGVVRAVAPTVILLSSGLTCIFLSHKTLKSEKAGIIAAYNILDTSFRNYRERVIDELGEDADERFRHGVTTKKIDDVYVDDDGKKHKVKKEIKTISNAPSDYARIFDKEHLDYHRYEYEGCYAMNANFMWLRGVESDLNRKLNLYHQLTLNDVYRALRLPESKAGAFVGWRDVLHGGKDGYISFGIDWDNPDGSILYYDDVAEIGNDYGILLDFNVDGIILDDEYDRITGTDLYRCV